MLFKRGFDRLRRRKSPRRIAMHADGLDRQRDGFTRISHDFVARRHGERLMGLLGSVVDYRAAQRSVS